MTKIIAVLGATGSVGMQSLDVARQRGYKIDLITAKCNVSAMEASVREFSPAIAVMTDETAAKDLSVRVADTKTKILSGSEGLLFAIENSSADTVVNSILGEGGLMPTLRVLESGKRLALANKESLVIAGNVVMSLAKEKNAELIPVDSEHSAIFQCLKAGDEKEVSRLLLTASGGPFYGKKRSELEAVTLSDVLAHPTWKMGKKITVDSATLMNKGFEIIEACHLFGISPSRIEVLIHRESILHSAVEYIDKAVIAQLSVPDMRECVQYAVDYPHRKPSHIEALDLIRIGRLTFSEPDYESFPLLALAKRAISDGGAMPAVMNAADEVAVAAYLSGKLSFSGIADTVIKTYEKMTSSKALTSLSEIISADREARSAAESIVKDKAL